ncbi:MAG: Flp pilus assembly complex ATPase component TadA [Mailhella sp.]|nr:Flp pilus assembly complex ATPase component TadA [Mailhella sp.]
MTGSPFERAAAAAGIDARTAADALRAAEERGAPPEDILLEEGAIDEDRFLALASAMYGLPYERALDRSIRSGGAWRDEPGLGCAAPLAWLRDRAVVPVRDAGGRLMLAASRPGAMLLCGDLAALWGEAPCGVVRVPSADVQAVTNRIFGESVHSGDSVADVLGGEALSLAEGGAESVEDLLEEDSDAPFIRLVNMLLTQAVRAGASDIHIEPYRDVSRVRFRLDGVLYERHTVEKAFHAALVSRIKVMARLNIAEKRLPQDGRIAVSLGGRQVGLRVSTLPTAFGERVVLRLLEKSERVLSLAELGLGEDDLARVRSLVGLTHCMILITGPTGSGKTTTLYAMLQALASPERNILTIEDPVEYELEGVGQMQVNTKIGLTFADGLRTLVRQDPDVILIGEIRDTETAAIAVQSALTGHLVLSTLHTNDAPSAVARLFDMGVEPFLLSSVLRAVAAQRLVRVLCPHCREAYIPDEQEIRSLGRMGALYRRGTPLYRPRGCPECMHTGYRGRMAVYELMPVTESLKKLIVEKADANVLRRQALEEGMYYLRDGGIRKVLEGRTSLAEVVRVTAG